MALCNPRQVPPPAARRRQLRAGSKLVTNAQAAAPGSYPYPPANYVESVFGHFRTGLLFILAPLHARMVQVLKSENPLSQRKTAHRNRPITNLRCTAAPRPPLFRASGK